MELNRWYKLEEGSFKKWVMYLEKGQVEVSAYAGREIIWRVFVVNPRRKSWQRLDVDPPERLFSFVASGVEPSSMERAGEMALAAYRKYVRYGPPRALFNARQNDDPWTHVHSGIWRRRMAPGHYLYVLESLGGNIWYWWIQAGKKVSIRKSAESFVEAKERATKVYHFLDLKPPTLFNDADPREAMKAKVNSRITRVIEGIVGAYVKASERKLWKRADIVRRIAHDRGLLVREVESILGKYLKVYMKGVAHRNVQSKGSETPGDPVAERSWWSQAKSAIRKASVDTHGNVIDALAKSWPFGRYSRDFIRETLWHFAREYKVNANVRYGRSSLKTFYVARFRPPYPQRGEFWTANEVLDLLPATVVGGVYKISAPTRALALAEAKAAHARGR